jgi:hypothetical protein
MNESICAGATIGFIALVVIVEFEFNKICRLCLCFWLSVVYSIISGNWWALGLVNLAAHLSFLTLKAVAYNERFDFQGGSSQPAKERVQGGEDRPQATETSAESGDV